MSAEVSPGPGHNRPPLVSSAAEIAVFLLEEEAQLLRRRGELQEGLVRFHKKCPTIDDDESYALAGDFKKQIQAALKIAEGHFEAVKGPFRDGSQAVDSFFNSLRGPLKTAIAEINGPMTAYAERKAAAKRQALEAAAKVAREKAQAEQAALAAGRPEATIETAIVHARAAEKAERAAAAPAAELTRGRGDYGSVSSLAESWQVEVENLSLVPREFLAFDEGLALKAVRVGGRREIPGLRIFRRRHVVTR